MRTRSRQVASKYVLTVLVFGAFTLAAVPAWGLGLIHWSTNSCDFCGPLTVFKDSPVVFGFMCPL
jgi:hypothetical protein